MKKIFITILLLLFGLIGKAQVQDFTQYYNNRLYINPAFAGIDVCPKLFLSARDKYMSLDHTYQTYYLSYEQNIYQVNLDFAGYIFRDDQSAVFRNTQFGIMLAKEFELKRNFIFKLGGQIGLNFESFRSESLTFNSMIDPIYGFINDSNVEIEEGGSAKLDVGIGALIYNNSFFVGISAFNLSQPQSGVNETILFYRRYNIHLGTEYNLRNNAFKQDIIIVPSISFMSQRFNNILNWGAQFKYTNFILGAFNKNFIDFDYDSFVILVGFEQKKFKFAYNCDFPMGNKSRKIFDTHEITLSYNFDCGKGRYRHRSIKCPGF